MFISLPVLFLLLALYLWMREDETPRAPVTWDYVRDRLEIAAAHTSWKARRRQERQQSRLLQQQARPAVCRLSPVVARLAWRAGFDTYCRLTDDLARCGGDWQARLRVLTSWQQQLTAEEPEPSLDDPDVGGQVIVPLGAPTPARSFVAALAPPGH